MVAVKSIQSPARGFYWDFKGGHCSAHFSHMYSSEDLELVQNLVTWTCCGIVVYLNTYQGILGDVLRGVLFLLHVS